ncbi:hypothetical protein I8J29_25950 [Paenibacillus sp. MWE-103]|uniref:Uncharacterized protein n=1 Tax=Paenibacillus artemisiicola TaxID=1172618 RepID=A0ABS3WH51_9BACL|nr:MULTISPECIES: hypothetical protein [Paenibacillus]MBO7747636.1 hypothetical protein [Paenibacillus artemisiicola]SFJ50389.1 hypothetical protein SAMN02799624_04783 [Paenibacillus sp. UNC496MF]
MTDFEERLIAVLKEIKSELGVISKRLDSLADHVDDSRRSLDTLNELVQVIAYSD